VILKNYRKPTLVYYVDVQKPRDYWAARGGVRAVSSAFSQPHVHRLLVRMLNPVSEPRTNLTECGVVGKAAGCVFVITATSTEVVTIMSAPFAASVP
jgi:hypothetical protein